MENISKHISYKEATHSNTALRRNLDNTPNDQQLKCMKEIAENLFEPLRKWVGGPIKVNLYFSFLFVALKPFIQFIIFLSFYLLF